MKVWVYLDGRQQGPFELEELLDMPVDATTKVWFEGLSKWYPAGTLEQMKPLFDGSLTRTSAPQQPAEQAETTGMSAASDASADDASHAASVASDEAAGQHAPAPAAPRRRRLPDEPCPPTYLGWSVFLLICCCSPLSLAAVVASICTSSYYSNGRLDHARKASEIAAWLVMLSIALGLLPVMLMSALF